jgi:hypothetical protein
LRYFPKEIDMAHRRPYQEIQQLVNEHGGTMKHKREGYEWGAWIVRVGNKQRIFVSNGSGYPELDQLYVPKPEVSEPKHWKDYSEVLVPDAWEKFIRYLS